MTNYERGRRLEWKVKKLMEAEGALVLRSAGSKGAADLVAMWPEFVYAIQCKAYKPTAAEIADVRKASESTDARWAMVSSIDGNLEVRCWKKGKPHPIPPPGLITPKESPEP